MMVGIGGSGDIDVGLMLCNELVQKRMIIQESLFSHYSSLIQENKRFVAFVDRIINYPSQVILLIIYIGVGGQPKTVLLISSIVYI